jgi:hypothetical protein
MDFGKQSKRRINMGPKKRNKWMIKALVIPSWLGRRTNFEKDKYINPSTQSKLTPSSLKKKIQLMLP